MKQKTAHHIKLLNKTISLKVLLFVCLAILCLTPIISPPIALLLGLLVAQFVGHPYQQYNGKATHFLLQASVVGLGFGINVDTAIKAGSMGLQVTVVSILGTLGLGLLLGFLFRIERKTSYLVSVGTAICGGSAIAAVSPAINAEEKQISVALGVVFILNSIALFLFPAIGHWLQLSQTQFGMWCAIAIHDTSSVVGAAERFGIQALEIATTVKLTRALWIIPVAFTSALLFRSNEGGVKTPWFIGLFVLAILANSYLGIADGASHFIVLASKAGLTLTLFLIGSGLSAKLLRSVGIRPLLQGVILWVVISSVTLWSVIMLF